jgi:hypothetical protein
MVLHPLRRPAMRQLLLVSAIAAALTLVLVPRVPAAPALGEKAVRYEYAELRSARTLVRQPGMAGPGVGVRGGVVGAQPAPAPAGPAMGGMMPGTVETSIRWTTAEEEIDVKEWEELADKLKAPAPKKVSPAAVHRLRVLNKLAADGWELMDHPPADTMAGALVFRRPAK